MKPISGKHESNITPSIKKGDLNVDRGTRN